MIRDLIRNTKLRHAISDVIGLVCMVIVMVAWLFIVAALSPAESAAPAAHATVSETLVILP